VPIVTGSSELFDNPMTGANFDFFAVVSMIECFGTAFVGRDLDGTPTAKVTRKAHFRDGRRYTPQGGVLSLLLSTIFLHEVLDRWFEEEVRPFRDG